MDAESAVAMENEPPKCKLIINIAAPIIFMLAVSIYAAVISTNGTELGTNDLIVISVILAVGALWIFGTILWYRKCCHQEVMKTVVICVKSQKKSYPEDKEARIQIVEIQTDDGLSPNSEKPLDGNDVRSETAPLCNDVPPTTTNATAGD